MDFAEEILVMPNAAQALDYLKADCGKDKKCPDLIILDLKMPGMDGFDFLREFEKMYLGMPPDTVVVILTTSRNADDIITLRGLGNYFLISKPLTKDNLIDIHHRYFRDPGLQVSNRK